MKFTTIKVDVQLSEYTVYVTQHEKKGLCTQNFTTF